MVHEGEKSWKAQTWPLELVFLRSLQVELGWVPCQNHLPVVFQRTPAMHVHIWPFEWCALQSPQGPILSHGNLWVAHGSNWARRICLFCEWGWVLGLSLSLFFTACRSKMCWINEWHNMNFGKNPCGISSDKAATSRLGASGPCPENMCFPCIPSPMSSPRTGLGRISFAYAPPPMLGMYWMLECLRNLITCPRCSYHGWEVSCSEGHGQSVEPPKYREM